MQCSLDEDFDPFLSSGTTAVEFFEGNPETFVRYLYDEYKQDVPLPCITAHYTTDLDWIFGGPISNPIIPLVGHFKGREGLIKFLELKGELLEVTKWERTKFVVQKDQKEGENIIVVVFVQTAYTIKKTMKSYEVEEVHVHHVTPDFKDAKVHITFDYSPLLEAWKP